MDDGFSDDWDSDDVLFADTDDDIARFLGPPEIDTGDTESDDRLPGSTSAGNVPVGTVGRISYDRGDNEIVGVPTELDDDYVPRARTNNREERIVAAEYRDRQATDTGLGNLRRLTREHPAGIGEGATGKHASIADAGNSLRLELVRGERGVSTSSGLDHRVESWLRLTAQAKDARLAGEQRNKLSARSGRTTAEAPTFSETEFNCEFYGLKMNNAGYWMLTLKIENSEGDRIMELSRSVGLNLKTSMISEGFA